MPDVTELMRPGTLSLPALPPLSLYIHFPWCVRKCPYCDFNSHVVPTAGLPERAYLDALLDALSPGRPVDLLGHSMGGNIAMSYAGVRPARIRRLVNLEGFGLPDAKPEAESQMLKAFERWSQAGGVSVSSIRCVIRSFFSFPPVSISRAGSFPLCFANARPKSMPAVTATWPSRLNQPVNQLQRGPLPPDSGASFAAWP